MLNFFKKLFALIFRPRSDKKAVAPPPAPTVMNLWPDGANAVKAFLMVPTGDLPRGRYTFVQQAYVRGQEARYGIYGSKESWRESGLKELVQTGKMVVLGYGNFGSGRPKAK
ncbi:MAG: hypothetical protein UW16_C0018G0012 [Microgenomates group bacterium GW2011_GWC1_44_10]|nr:MAG: hypothetical protein UW16_C0018G0012 [Microgenomates group bacterium GW2011_GWC1_44_10]